MSENDYGFTTINEEDLEVGSKLQQMRDLIQPLLESLMENPNGNIIKWDGAKRVEQIKSFIAKLDAICPYKPF